ncbi:adenosylcobinamide-phosphate synthase CbiB [Methylovirgula sp. HY1]|uniref:adenosylcobinamide-phosphate synthase CbiB n=1 Tax=Methylovirgula sp. HY1 TaxID=2822761 RepID=UPI001C5AFDEC|nr:adenosylcobinamide-phosphate synthase CbiB [Methylovirgula sp. HY1]QXX76213.1 Cobalamin biosynthesis protein CobD [Methylovirgula sp. HY1]
MSWALSLSLACAALAVEAAFGYPPALYRRIGHPVTWIGALITASEARINRVTDSPWLSRVKGLASLLFWLAVTVLVTGTVTWICGASPWLFPVLVLLAASLPAQRSLYEHVAAVADALEGDGLEAARKAVGQIVGRRTDALDTAGIARAAIESLAENFSDGIVAPAFWLGVGGLTGGVLYKAINTADSMIGHRTKRYEYFGWASARLDDLVNLPASRLAALFLILAALFDGWALARNALGAILRDAGHHRSPNAGWPEAAMAGALGLKLAGPRLYEEGLVDDAFMGDGRRDAAAHDIRYALKLMRRACFIQFMLLAGLALWISLRG